MTPILGITASSITSSILAGDYQSIATVTVTTATAASIDFTSIPQTFTHLQLRGIARSTNAATTSAIGFQFNSDTATNYALHILYGDGASASAGVITSASTAGSALNTGNNATAGRFGAIVVDILDYNNTNKNTTTRILSGADLNGSGQIRLGSGLWLNTSAVTSIKIIDLNAANIAQHSTFALYGIKGA